MKQRGNRKEKKMEDSLEEAQRHKAFMTQQRRVYRKVYASKEKNPIHVRSVIASKKNPKDQKSFRENYHS